MKNNRHKTNYCAIIALACSALAPAAFGMRSEQEQAHLDRSLLQAIERNDAQAAEELLNAGANREAITQVGYPPQQLANRGNLGQWVVEHGAPLHHAARYGNKEVARLLLEYRANKKAATRSLGVTPLHIAACRGHTEFARFLLEQGASKNHRDALGFTPLHFAAQSGPREMVAFLVAHGAKVQAGAMHPDHRLARRVMKVCSWPIRALARIVSKPTGLARPLKRVASEMKTVGKYARTTPLYLAARNRHEGVARTFIDAGAMLGNDRSLLYWAMRTDAVRARDAANIARTLLAAGESTLGGETSKAGGEALW